jgi:uncharacterized protein
MDEDLVRRLREAAAQAFGGEPVVFAYLFGSHASGGTHPSNVDIAVYVEDSIPPSSYFDLRLRLPTALSSAGVGEVNVVVLNEAPLPIRGRAVRDGIVIYSRDEPIRIRHHGRTLKEFFDFQIHFGPQSRRASGRL